MSNALVRDTLFRAISGYVSERTVEIILDDTDAVSVIAVMIEAEVERQVKEFREGEE